jgi:methyl-accepting chemotaxis protein
MTISSVAEEEGQHAGKVSVSVDDIARSSETTVVAMGRSDEASHEIGELLAALQAKAAQFRV